MDSETKSSPPPPYTPCTQSPKDGNHTTIYGHKNQTDQWGDNNHNRINGNENKVVQTLTRAPTRAPSPSPTPAQTPAPVPTIPRKTLDRAWARMTFAVILIFVAWEVQNLLSAWMLDRKS